MRAENFLYFNNNRIQGEDLLPVKCIKVPKWLRLLSVLRRWSVVVDFLFIVTPIVGVCNCSFFCCMLLFVHSSIAITLMGKRELVALLNLSSWCLVMVEWLFLAVPWGYLLFVIVVFPDHTHLLFLIFVKQHPAANDSPQEQKLDWMLQAKKRLLNASFINKRWSCTKQPSWNFSNNFFQTIYSLEQKFIGMHHATWRLRINKIISFRYKN